MYNNRISKIEDNVYILHDKMEELSNTIDLQKTMLDELYKELVKIQAIVSNYTYAPGDEDYDQ